MEHQNTSTGMIHLVTGFNPIELSKQQLNYAKALVIGSISTAVLFALIVAWDINLHIRFLGVSVIIGIALFCVFLIINRTLFVLSVGMSKWFIVAVISYMTVYLIVCITVVSNPVQYFFLIQNVDKTNMSTALDEMSTIESLRDQLNQSQIQTLRKLKGTFSIISFVFSMIPLIILFTFRKQQSPFERETAIQKQAIERRLLEAKRELADLFSIPSANKDEFLDPFFTSEQPLTENIEERMLKGISLQREISHLTLILNTHFS